MIFKNRLSLILLVLYFSGFGVLAMSQTSTTGKCKDKARIVIDDDYPGQESHARANPASTGGADQARGSATVTARWLNTMNVGASHYHVASIQFRRDKTDSHFALYLGNNVPAYAGNDPGEMIRQLNALSPLPKGGQYYVALDGFEPRRAANIVETIKNQQDIVDPAISIEPVDRGSGTWSGILFQQVVGIRGAADIRELQSGWFEGRQRIVQKDRSGIRERVLWARAKSRSFLERFFQLIRNTIASSPGTPPSSVAEVVNSARATLRQELNFKDAEFKAAVIEQTGRSYIVEIWKSEKTNVPRPV